MNIFEMQYINSRKKSGPLAQRMRPNTLYNFIGQNYMKDTENGIAS